MGLLDDECENVVKVAWCYNTTTSSYAYHLAHKIKNLKNFHKSWKHTFGKFKKISILLNQQLEVIQQNIWDPYQQIQE